MRRIKNPRLRIGQLVFLVAWFAGAYYIAILAGATAMIALAAGAGAVAMIFLFLILAPVLAVLVFVASFLLLLVWAFAPGNTLGWSIPWREKSAFQIFAELFVMASATYFAFNAFGFLLGAYFRIMDFLRRILGRIV